MKRKSKVSIKGTLSIFLRNS
ncbi:hypothetical protein VCHENC02_2094A, partial [Vibrio harveyi]